MPALPFVNEEDLPEDIRAVFEAREQDSFLANSLRIMAHRPDILRAYVGMSAAVYRNGLVDKDLKALVGHIRSGISGCRYCQAHTANHAVSHGMAEKLDHVWEFETSERFTPAEKAALRLARDASYTPNSVTGEHFVELQRHFSVEEIIELVAVVCHFAWLNTWNDSLATDLEEIPWFTAEENLKRTGWEPGKHAGAAD